MKTITKEIEKTIKETKTVYVADDGEEFYSETECKNYENSALYAISKRITGVMTKVKRNLELDELCDNGNDYADYYILNFKNENQIKDFISYTKLAYEGVSCNSRTFENEEGRKAYYETYKNTHYVFFEELKTKTDYILWVREGWASITSKEKLENVINNGWKKLFEKEEKSEKTE